MDGLDLEWTGIPPTATDPAGDSQCGEGSDLTEFASACKPEYLYILQRVADGLASSSFFHFHLDFSAGGTTRHYVLEMSPQACTLFNEDGWTVVGYPAGFVRSAAEARIPWGMLGSPEELDINPITPGPPCDW